MEYVIPWFDQEDVIELPHFLDPNPHMHSYYNNINNLLGAHQARLVMHNTNTILQGSTVHVHPQRISAYYKTQFKHKSNL